MASEIDREVVNGLVNHHGMRRVSGFVKRKLSPQTSLVPRKLTRSLGSMETFAPRLNDFVMKTLDSLKDYDPSLEFPYQRHPFVGLTFNIGPKVCTKPHKDRHDLSWGWCAVTSLGSFDHTKGGHLVLWDLKLVVEFPAYSTIFIPSAILWHSNTAVGDGEQRSSVTQYNSGGLFRWVAYDNSLKKGREESGKDWWDSPRPMFSPLPNPLST